MFEVDDALMNRPLDLDKTVDEIIAQESGLPNYAVRKVFENLM